eukprot:6643214-Karenia_brevis.AAC.1
MSDRFWMDFGFLLDAQEGGGEEGTNEIFSVLSALGAKMALRPSKVVMGWSWRGLLEVLEKSRGHLGRVFGCSWKGLEGVSG